MKIKLILITAIAMSLTAIPLTHAGTVDAAKIWVKDCAACHGKDGKGRTRAGRIAKVKDMTDAKYQKTFTDEKAVERIEKGLKDKSGKERMKPFAEKLNKDEIKALVEYVRKFKKGE
jgi:cytochrome c553